MGPFTLAEIIDEAGCEISVRQKPPKPILKQARPKTPDQNTRGEHAMTKERQSNKESKKKPALTLKEKRSAKKSKHESKPLLGNGKSGLA
jgi:hypothetical protein